MKLKCPFCGCEFEGEPTSGSAQCENPACSEFFNVGEDDANSHVDRMFEEWNGDSDGTVGVD